MVTNPIRDRYDVVVAGARCAGASVAMLLARSGLEVLVVDPLPRGRDALSTHALMRGGVMQLRRWGLLEAVRAAGTPPVRTTSFHYGPERVDIPIKAGDGIDALFAPRRTVLDPILQEAAEAAGAQVVHGASVTGVTRDRDGRIRGAWIATADAPAREVTADLVIGADGVRSRVARLVEAQTVRTAPNAAAAIYGHWPGVGTEGYHWHFGSGAAAGAIPTNDGRTCVFAAVPPTAFRDTAARDLPGLYESVLRALDPGLAEAVSRGPTDVRLRAFPGIPGFLRRSFGPGWALVGDAAFFRDPITAHGITDAFREADLLAHALLSPEPHALAAYERDRNVRVSGILEITDRISSFDWDMEEVKALHLDLSRAMNVGVDALRALDAEPALQSAAAVPVRGLGSGPRSPASGRPADWPAPTRATA